MLCQAGALLPSLPGLIGYSRIFEEKGGHGYARLCVYMAVHRSAWEHAHTGDTIAHGLLWGTHKKKEGELQQGTIKEEVKG